MISYRLFTDSACDIPQDILNSWGYGFCSLSYVFEGDEKEYTDGELSAAEFYGRVRSGASAKTSAVNVLAFSEAFRAVLSAGQDLLYIGFSGGLSSTCHHAELAAQELREEFPERKILTVDSLCASAGLGLLLYLTSKRAAAGASIEEAADFAEKTKLHICHWFTVDNLDSLLRGGRVKNALAAVGGMLGIKPVVHMDNEGHLVPVSVSRGRRLSLRAIADKYKQLALVPGEGPVYISHADCMDDVNMLKDILRERCGADVDFVADVGSVIGSHTGAGVISIFFVGKER